jgi:polygalacturonase
MPDTNLADIATQDLGPQATTRALQQAIDQTADRGGGVVHVPRGEWTILTLALRSGVTLHLDYGAVLKACHDIDLYPTFGNGHNKARQSYHLIYADGCEQIAIRGQGAINGQGMAFWHDPAPGTPWYRANARRISPMIEIRNSRHVLLEGVSIVDSPGWTVHPYNCDHVTIRGLTLDSHLYGPNTDGIDVNGCRDVFISDCYISGCDDAIIIKSTVDARSTERVAVTNCVLATKCGALGLGAECNNSIRDIAFSNCVVKEALRMIAVEMWSPGTIENIVFSNITGRTMTDMLVERPIYIDIQQHRQAEPISLGRLRNVSISNFTATTRGRIVMTAQDGAVLEDVTLRDVQLIIPEIEDPAVVVPATASSQISNFSPESRGRRAAVVADNVRRLQLYNISTRWPEPAAVPMHGLYARNVESGVLDAPYLYASRTGTPAIVQENSHLVVRAVGHRGE